MKIAVPIIDNEHIDEHFGRCESYLLFTISDTNEIIAEENLPSEQGCGCKSNIANVLVQKGVSVMLAGNIGSGAINVLNRAGIRVIRGCKEKPREAVKRYVNGEITDNGQICTQHENCSHD